jgi:alkylated DNA repair protein alkB family protein 8
MTIRRRVQHYGFQFKYSELNVGDSAVTDFPPIVKDMILSHDELKRFDFNQLTINEYVSGIGIASHCDTHSAFTDTIAVVSLLNPIVMDFVSHDNAKKVSVIIPPRSLMLMSGESRYGWRHAIASRKTDLSLDGTPAARERRVSLTFRRIQKCTCECPFASLCDSQGADFLRPRRMQSG